MVVVPPGEDGLLFVEIVGNGDNIESICMEFPSLVDETFDNALETLMSSIVGWDMKSESAMAKAGVFGVCCGLRVVVEEQGPRSKLARVLALIRESH